MIRIVSTQSLKQFKFQPQCPKYYVVKYLILQFIAHSDYQI